MRVNVNSKFSKSYSPNSEFDNKKKEKSQTKIYENNKMFIEVGVFL